MCIIYTHTGMRTHIYTHAGAHTLACTYKHSHTHSLTYIRAHTRKHTSSPSFSTGTGYKDTQAMSINTSVILPQFMKANYFKIEQLDQTSRPSGPPKACVGQPWFTEPVEQLALGNTRTYDGGQVVKDRLTSVSPGGPAHCAPGRQDSSPPPLRS